MSYQDWKERRNKEKEMEDKYNKEIRETINKRTKKDIYTFLRNFNQKGISNLKKTELIEKTVILLKELVKLEGEGFLMYQLQEYNEWFKNRLLIHKFNYDIDDFPYGMAYKILEVLKNSDAFKKNGIHVEDVWKGNSIIYESNFGDHDIIRFSLDINGKYLYFCIYDILFDYKIKFKDENEINQVYHIGDYWKQLPLKKVDEFFNFGIKLNEVFDYFTSEFKKIKKKEIEEVLKNYYGNTIH
ncbi:MAG: hypothetical protein ACFFG0_41150 [Candidatus Thorarchaeota archaeon]